MLFKGLSLAVLAPLMLTACGGDKDSKTTKGATTNAGQSIEAQFIDAPVVGLGFRRGDAQDNSYTGTNGKFDCKQGELVTFYLKNLELGSAKCGDKIYISDMKASSKVSTYKVAAAMIQSFGKNENGIIDLSLVNDDVSVEFSDSISLDESNADTEIQSIITALQSENTYTRVTLVDAQRHVEEHLPDQSQNTAVANFYDSMNDGKAYLHFKRVSGNTDECQLNTIAEVVMVKNVIGVDKTNKITYTLGSPRQISFDNADIDESVFESSTSWNEACGLSKSNKSRRLINKDEDVNYVDVVACSNEEDAITPKLVTGNKVLFTDIWSKNIVYHKDEYQLCESEYGYYFYPIASKCIDGIPLQSDFEEKDHGSADFQLEIKDDRVEAKTNSVFNYTWVEDYANGKIITGKFSGSCSYSATLKYSK